jgi:hypothetical protein
MESAGRECTLEVSGVDQPEIGFEFLDRRERSGGDLGAGLAG